MSLVESSDSLNDMVRKIGRVSSGTVMILQGTEMTERYRFISNGCEMQVGMFLRRRAGAYFQLGVTGRIFGFTGDMVRKTRRVSSETAMILQGTEMR